MTRADYIRKWRKERVDAGLCEECGKPNSNGKRRCDECRANAKIRYMQKGKVLQNKVSEKTAQILEKSGNM